MKLHHVWYKYRLLFEMNQCRLELISDDHLKMRREKKISFNRDPS